MDPQRSTFIREMAGWAVLFLLIMLLLAWYVYDSIVVKMDPSALLESHNWRYGFVGALGLFLLFAVIFFIRMRRIRGAGTSSAGSPQGQRSSFRSFDSMADRTGIWIIACIFGIYLLICMYSALRSVPVLLVLVGIVFVCYGLARRSNKPAGLQPFIFMFYTLIAVPVVTLLGFYVVTPYEEINTIIPAFTYALPFVLALLLISVPVRIWISDHGIPFLRPIGDDDLKEPCKKELVVPLSFDRAFAACMEAAEQLPGVRIGTVQQVIGRFSATAWPGWGRASSIDFVLERISEEKTRVTISIVSENPSSPNEPKKRTHVNKKYMRVLEYQIQRGK